VWTPGGVVRCTVAAGSVRVEMGRARRGAPREIEGVLVNPVDVGNPHAVVFGVPADWEARGARIERSVEGRTNVQFVEVTGPQNLRAWVWERGAGRTRSSGSSACAVATVGVGLGRVTSPVRVEMEGGVLTVDVAPDGAVELEGPVEGIGRVEVDPEWLARRA
jgi:diaminopimelate epimerase